MEMSPAKSDSSKTDENSSRKKPKIGGVQRICSSFFQSSTIPAIALVYQRISIIWKVLWFIIAIVGLTISIYQSVELVKNYLAYPSNLVEIEKVNRTVYFPSVTLCPRNILNWQALASFDNVSIDDNLRELVVKLLENKTMYEIRMDLEHDILQDLHTMDKETREYFLFGPNLWFKGCFIQKFGGQLKKCEDESKDFLVDVYSPYYGLCKTINPGFPGGYRFRDDSRTTILILTETADDFDFPYLSYLSGMLVSIHSPGSAPVIPFNKRLSVVPGTWLQLSTSVYDLNRLPHPYGSNCTTDESLIAEELNLFSPYRDDIEPNHYSYSREECMGMCFQMTIVDEKQCINPFLAVNEDIESTVNYVCDSDIMTDEYMAQLERECAVKCQKRCHEFKYEWTPVTQELPQDDAYLLDFIAHVSPNSSKQNNSEYLNDVVSLISLNMESTIHVVGTEVPKIEIEDVFGAVGGNLGLWIGVSMLSIFEIFEFIVQLIAHGCHRLHKYCKRRSHVRQSEA